MPCETPYCKKNPYYGLKHLAGLRDIESQYINIPCGHCPSCIAVKQMYLVQRVQMEALVNHLFFATLTYNDDFLPRYEVNGYSIPYACMDDFVLSIKRIREKHLFPRPFRYFAVSERGTIRGRPHIHCLFLIPKQKSDDLSTCYSFEETMRSALLENWAANLGSDSHPHYVPRCTFVEKFIHGKLYRNYDLHYVVPSLSSDGVSDVAFYVLKYMLKDSDKDKKLYSALKLNLTKEDFDIVWSIVKSRFSASLGFGLGSSDGTIAPEILDHLQKGIKATPLGSPYPFYFNPDNGMSFPLCPYYRRNSSIYTPMMQMDIHFNACDDFELRVDDKAIKDFKDYAKKVNSVSLRDVTSYFVE